MDEDQAISISALNQFAYCPRRCGLIVMEGDFADNIHTARGTAEHEKADSGRYETVDDRRIETALPLWCERLGLVGKADVVEFFPDGTPYPVEYKHGVRKKHLNDDIQLAAQAVCLEEMTGKAVPKGAIYHHSSRHRREVAINAELRAQLETVMAEVRAMLEGGVLPAPVNDARCRECSLIDLCQPQMLGETARLHAAAASLYEVTE